MRSDGIAGPLCVAQCTSQTAGVHARKQPVGYLWGHDRRDAEIFCARFALDVLVSADFRRVARCLRSARRTPRQQAWASPALSPQPNLSTDIKGISQLISPLPVGENPRASRDPAKVLSGVNGGF